MNLRAIQRPVDAPPRVVRSVRLDRSSTPEALRDELRRQILGGDIPSGARLVEADIADAFGVSRQTLRSALAELVHEGILRHAPNRGVWVPSFTADDIRDVFYMRGVVEGEAAACIAADPAKARHVQPALDRLIALADVSGESGFGDAHTAFHQALVDAAGSARLSRAYLQLRSESALCLIASRTESCSTPISQAVAHQALLDAIVAGPPRAARRAAIAHLQSGMRTALEAIGDHVGPEIIPARQVARSRR
jgi:DNA-binding GntR family transcriptional regulator